MATVHVTIHWKVLMVDTINLEHSCLIHPIRDTVYLR